MTANVFSRFFTTENKHWSTNPEHNEAFLKAQENWLNDRLRAQRIVLLNDVYDALGLGRTRSGATFGWYKELGSKKIRFDMATNSNTNEIFISFETDGPVVDKLPA